MCQLQCVGVRLIDISNRLLSSGLLSSPTEQTHEQVQGSLIPILGAAP